MVLTAIRPFPLLATANALKAAAIVLMVAVYAVRAGRSARDQMVGNTALVSWLGVRDWCSAKR